MKAYPLFDAILLFIGMPIFIGILYLMSKEPKAPGKCSKCGK